MNVEYDINELSSMINDLAKKCRECTEKIEKLQDELGNLRAVPVEDIFKTYEKQSDFKKQIDKKSASIKRLFKKYNELFEQQMKYDAMRFQLIEYNMQLNEKIDKLNQEIDELNEDIDIHFKYASFHNLVLKKQERLRLVLLEKKDLEYQRSLIFDRSKKKEDKEETDFDITIEDNSFNEEDNLDKNALSDKKDILKIDVVSYANSSLDELFELNKSGFITDEELGLILNKRYEILEHCLPKPKDNVISKQENNSSELVKDDISKEPVIETIKSKKKSSKLTWRAYASIAGGVAAGSLVHFVTNGVGDVFASLAAAKVNSNIDKIREKKSLFSDILPNDETLEILQVEDASLSLKDKVKKKLQKISNHMNSDEGLRDLSYFLKSLYTTSMALDAFGIVNSMGGQNGHVDEVYDVSDGVFDDVNSISDDNSHIVIDKIYNSSSDALAQSNEKIPLKWIDSSYGSHVAEQKNGAFLIKDSNGLAQGWIPYDDKINIGDMVDTNGRGI